MPIGSFEFMFSRKAVFECKAKEGIDIESLELELIDAGLEEIELVDDVLYLYADFTNYGQLHHAIEDQKLEIIKSNLQRFANNPMHFTDEQKVDIEKMLDKIEEDDDVQAVYTNMA